MGEMVIFKNSDIASQKRIYSRGIFKNLGTLKIKEIISYPISCSQDKQVTGHIIHKL